MKLRKLTSIFMAMAVMSCAHMKVNSMNFTPDDQFYYSEDNYLNYRVIGEGKRKVIFLHGFGASNRTWDDVIPRLDLSDSQLILFDLIGSGFSSKPRVADYSMMANATAITRFIKEREIEVLSTILCKFDRKAN